MSEHVRVLSDGNRLVVVIENADREIVDKVKEIFGVTIEKITGLDHPPVKDEKKDKNNEEMYVFPSSSKKYHGQTVLEVLQDKKEGLAYISYILLKTEYKRKNDIWRDLNLYHKTVADILEENLNQELNSGDLSGQSIFTLCDIYDHEPNKPPVTPTILKNIKTENLQEIANDKQKCSYVLNTLIEYIRTKGDTNE